MSTPPTPPTPPGPGRSTGPGPGKPSPTTGTAEAAPEGELHDHRILTSLLGAWALAACSAEETAAVEAHLTDCAPCAEEALRLRDAVGLLHAEDSLDLDPMLRSRVLQGCLDRRPARIPMPTWAAPYDAETARLDALLRDMADAEWRAPVQLRWFDGDRQTTRETTVAGVIGHLLAVDGLVAAGIGLPDPLPADALPTGSRSPRPTSSGAPFSGAPFSQARRGEPGADPQTRTEIYWALEDGGHHTPAVREPWREQSHAMIRDVSFLAADDDSGSGPSAARNRLVSYGNFSLPLRDAFLDRAFECWMHAEDIAEAVDYPYGPPGPAHLNLLVDLAARQLPGALAARRRTGLAPPPHGLAAAGAPGRTLHLEVEGNGGGDWYIPLDSPGARASPEGKVAHIALDGLEFCQLAAGHVPPLEAAAGQDGDLQAVRDVLYATASLSRL
ncbi:anti-sigma factor [Streptomyces sp. B15]|uniref:anti-sigma factor family protein n=1 Tax=Streptomyces sp. B15 TaxID=1537797 RepID=UPI001B35A55B|nr:zf-HC2 domain-containing protein [Streptomyces sp. B15]MBQ1119067.1 zf-HC2 domain-containing protein [Streptomyces sp. B15]